MAKLMLVCVLLLWLSLRIAAHNDDLLHIVFCDVGQGDAILIRHGSAQMLVDGGRDTSVLECLDEHMPVGDRSLEVVVATHPDADHIVGLTSVLDFYRFELLILNGQDKKTADFERFKAALEKRLSLGGAVTIAQQGKTFKLDNSVDVSMLYPHNMLKKYQSKSSIQSETVLSDVDLELGNPSTNYNNSSVVLRMSYFSLEILLTGDLEKEGEQALVNENLITDADVLKVGHHGAKTSTTPDFLRAVAPEICVISVGKNNSYGHPDPLVLQRLDESGCLVLRTDALSTIELVSNGHSIWQAKGNPFLEQLLEGSQSANESP